jgi:hypothetical protein
MYKTVILPVVLYGYETLSLTLREVHRSRMSAIRVPRRIFGPGKEQQTAGWRKMHNEVIHNLQCSPDIIRVINSRRMRRMRHV